MPAAEIVSSGNGYIIVLDDLDMAKLVNAKNRKDQPAIDNILLSHKLSEILLNAHT